MNNERTPFVTDKQFDAMLDAASGGWTKIKRFGPAAGVCRKIRDIYEAELSRKDAEIEALREEVAAMMSSEAYKIESAYQSGREKGYAEGYQFGASITHFQP